VDVPIAGLLARKARTSSQTVDVLLPVTSRPSRLVAGATTPQMASVVLSLLVIVGGFLLVVEAMSVLSSVKLTRTITRSVDDLHRGTLKVSDGDFSQQIPCVATIN
jgi:hypothetical protein